MLTEERYSKILETVNQQKSVTIGELCYLLSTSESTVRRDLNALAEKGLLLKVHGGAIALNETFAFTERNVEEKSHLHIEEKNAIARFAASLIDEGDFIFLDAGTTTEKMIDYFPVKDVSFVTNAFLHARKLAQRGFKVYIPAGKIKISTEAIVGAECVSSIQEYNFTKSFIGANGVSLASGISTPDRSEASVKAAVISRSRQVYVLADHSKFDQISSVTFAQFNKVKIITDRIENRRYKSEALIKEVM